MESGNESHRIGAVYPQTEMGGRPENARRFASEIAGAGLRHLLAYDHVLGATHDGREPALTGPYTERDPFHDPITLFAHLAGLVPDLEFVPGVLVLAQRQTALVARQVADLSLLSGGRVRLGVGTGWNPVEFEALGVAFADRGRRMDEQIDVLRRLWTGEVVDLSGEFHRIDRAALNPVPEVPVAIWVGGNHDRALRRAARVGDGYLASSSAPDQFERLSTMKRFLDEAGRPSSPFGFDALVRIAGPPSAAARVGLDWFEAGGTHASIVSLGRGLPTVDAHLEYVIEVADLMAKG